MNTAKVYHDIDGNECTIWQMVEREPEWAAVRIQVGEEAIEKVDQLRARIAELERQLEKELANRDRAEGQATRLAEAVGEWFGVGVGEHSNMNCPVEEAHKALNGEYVSPKIARKLTKAKAEALEEMAKRFSAKSAESEPGTAWWSYYREAAHECEIEARRLRDGGGA